MKSECGHREQMSRHAGQRLAQRGFQASDLDLIRMIGVDVLDGAMMLARDCQPVAARLRALADRVERPAGSRAVWTEDTVVTVYRARAGKQRDLLRCAAQRDLRG